MFTYTQLQNLSLLVAERMYKKTKTAEKIYDLLCATGTKKMTLNSPDFAAYEISFKIT